MPEKLPVRLLKAAEKELHGSADYYNEERPGRGDDFLRLIRAVIEDIAEYPLRWPASDISRRRALTRVPFTIHYRVDATEIVILAIAHQKRRPGYWSRDH